MNKRTHAPWPRLAHAAALVVIFSLAWLSPSPASAQLGSLIVTITSPTSGSTVSGTLTVSADVSIIGSLTVAGVEFYVDGKLIGTDTTAPYSVAWDTKTVSNGSHTLTAIARDLLGLGYSSDPVTVTVSNDTTAPTVSITAPSGGATVSGTIGVTADASDDVGVTRVEFFVDGNKIGEDTTSPYSVAWDTKTVGNGDHTLTARAHDAAGNVGTSSSVGVTVSNDTTAPTVSITSPAAGATVSGTIGVTADASDNVGVTRVEFFVDGNKIGEDTTAPYEVAWNTTTVADGSYTLTARAHDAAGNTTTSAEVGVTVANAAPPATLTWTRFEETNLSITYTPGVGTNAAGDVSPVWFHGSTSRGWSGGLASFNRSTGAQATIRFTGTAVRWIGFRAPWAGIADVYVDGDFAERVDLYLGDEEEQAVVFERTGLEDTSHTLEIRVTGENNPLASDYCAVEVDPVKAARDCYAVVVDAFDVAPSSSAPRPAAGRRFEETDPAVTYPLLADGTTGWTSDTARGWSGGAARVSATAGARARLTFTGTEVRWIGLRGPGTGIARVFLDGAFHAAVDTYSATEVQAVVFTATELADASHTLEIEVTGLRNAAATGNLIVVDAFDVRSRFEDRHPSIAYTGTWALPGNMDKAWSGTAPPRRLGTAAITVTQGAVAEFRFRGTSVSWIGMRGPQGGRAAVFLDGAFVDEVETFAATEQVQAVVFSTPVLDDGPHTLRIEKIDPTGSATSGWIVVDAFDIEPSTPAPAVTRFQETSAGYTDGWTPRSDRFWSGGTAMVSGTAGEEATFTFTGTAVRWVGHCRSDFGIAHVFLDGEFRAAVDTRAEMGGEGEAPCVVFSATGLLPGGHELVIRVIGRNGELAGLPVEPVVVDAFEVY